MVEAKKAPPMKVAKNINKAKSSVTTTKDAKKSNNSSTKQKQNQNDKNKKQQQQKESSSQQDDKESKSDNEIDSSISSNEEDEQDVLKREILALGGNEEDLQLLGDISDSDETEEGDDDSSIDPSLEKDFNNLIRELKLKPFESDKKQTQKSNKKEQGPVETDAPVSKPKEEPKKKQHKGDWIIEPSPVWYSITPKEQPPKSSFNVSDALINAAFERANSLLESEASHYSSAVTSTSKQTEASHPVPLNASDRAFFSNIITSGTASDRLSALVLVVSASPIHALNFLKQLMNSAQKKSREESTRAIRAISDWLRGGDAGSGAGGLPDRKLVWFKDQPGLKDVVSASKSLLMNKNASQEKGKYDDWLILWAFEHWIKQWYFDLLAVIETLSHDPLPFVRKQSVTHFFFLLRDKPEQEQNLLRLLINKLGDPEGSIAAKTSHHLLEILGPHPMMKQIIISEVSDGILRPPAISSAPSSSSKNSNDKKKEDKEATNKDRKTNLRYYGIITLNQVLLVKGQDEAIARRLINVYFEVFNDIMKDTQNDNDSEERPKDSQDKKKKQFNSKKRKRQQQQQQQQQDNKKSPKDAAEMFDDQVLQAEGKILAAILTGVKRAFPYANVDYEALEDRMSLLFKVIHSGPFNVSIQALALIHQMAIHNKELEDRYYRSLYATLIDPRLPSSSKQALYLSLLFSSLNQDSEFTRLCAFVKRILQILATQFEPPFVVASLELLKQLFNQQPNLRFFISNNPQESLGLSKQGDKKSETKESTKKYQDEYDSTKRNPLYAKAETSFFWELDLLVNHYHPTVAHHAKALIDPTSASGISESHIKNEGGKDIHINLELHTLSHFLDRFVYRNPKKLASSNDENVKAGVGKSIKNRNAKEVDLESWDVKDIADMDEQNIPVDRLFLHRFFSTKGVKKAKKQRDDEVDSDDDIPDIEDEENDSLDEDEDEIWKAMQATMPGQEDDDIVDDSLDEDDGEDEDEDESEGVEDEDEDEDEKEDEEESEDIDIDEEEVEDEGDDESEEGGQPGQDQDEAAMLDEDDDDLVGLSDVDFDAYDQPPPQLSESEDDGDKNRSRKKRRKMMKSLPTFASADDYAHLLEGNESDNDL